MMAEHLRLIGFVVTVLCPSLSYGISTDYFNTVCNVTSKTLSTSLRLESSTRLHYSADTSCFYHVVADTGKVVLLHVRIFDLENTVLGSCVDYVNIHDGADTSASTLNTSPLCGRTAASNYTSTGNEMTVYFKSDSTGQSLGFDFIFVAITTGTCTSSQFTCVNTSICIDSSLVCNTVDECGDGLDENNCVYTVPSTNKSSNAGLIAGAIIGGFIFLVLCLVGGVQLWKYYRWRLFHAKPINAKEIEFEPITYKATYPVTNLYYKEKFQNFYQDPRKVGTNTVQGSQVSHSSHATGFENQAYETETD